MKSRKKRSKQSQTDDAPDRRTTRKSERAARRESGTGNDDKQANQSVARTRKSTLARAFHDPEGGGLYQASRPTRAGERGAGRKKKEDEGTRA